MFIKTVWDFKVGSHWLIEMTSNSEIPGVGHRHSLTIETNPLHLLPSNIRRFSQAGSLEHPSAPVLATQKETAEPPPQKGVRVGFRAQEKGRVGNVVLCNLVLSKESSLPSLLNHPTFFENMK
uniref:Uncharacterized protein n=1 Tax=Angiostrongylus cantonensis TaxID=6313 RepID=A0A158PBA6_ANGCA